MTSRFVYNRSAEAELKRSAVLQAKLREKAGNVAQAAQATGSAVSRSYTTEVVDGDDGGVRVEANTGGINAAGWIEMGTVNNPAWAPLRRAVESAGLKSGGPSSG